MAQILIVDDDPAIMMACRDEFLFQVYEVEMALDGPSALEKADTFEPDVMLLDVMLPGMNGFEVCRQLRQKRPDLWIIMLTVREHEVDRIRGLEQGADDYVTKPFSLRELVARIKVGLRRRQTVLAQPVVTFGDVEVDLRAHRAFKRGREVALTPTEFGIIELLVRKPGAVITRDEFLDTLWGEETYVTPRVVDTHMAALRRKLEDDPNHPVYLHSVRGIGYRLDTTPAES